MKPIDILPDRNIEWCNSEQSLQTCTAHSDLVRSMLGTLLKLWSIVVPTKLLGQEVPAWQLEPLPAVRLVTSSFLVLLKHLLNWW